MMPYQTTNEPMSWEELKKHAPKELNHIEGPTNSYSNLRLFGQSENSVRVTLYRDHHAWCPYCQKVWLWLEWKKIPYKIRKVTMRCYGRKENWYLQKVRSGMLPAIEIDQKLITESDQILLALEDTFGALGTPLNHPESLVLRNLERKLFRSWCLWLCRPYLNIGQEERAKEQFKLVATEMEEAIANTKGPWMDRFMSNNQSEIPGSSDIIFIPYIERMNASLAYYKGMSLREEHPKINNWFQSLEKQSTYRGTQGDFHTHSHDLPPQMGGCWFNNYNPNQELLSKAIDLGEGLGELELCFSKDKTQKENWPELTALARVLKHREVVKQVNPLGPLLFDQPLRAALTNLLLNNNCTPNADSAIGLRYLKDRISVPRDMPLLAARKLRQALEKTAQLDGPTQGPVISTQNRFDQNPEPFLKANQNHII